MEATLATGLTREDIKAMRQADTMSFHHHQGKGSIMLVKRIANAGPFDDRERRYEIECERSHVYVYRPEDRGEYCDESASCFAMLHGNYEDSNCWAAVCLIAKPGDSFRLKWTADGCNEYFRKSQSSTALHYDQLSLQIVRDDRVICTLPVDTSICPDNTARMIRGT